MSRTLATALRYLLNSVLFCLIVVLSGQVANMANTPVEAANGDASLPGLAVRPINQLPQASVPGTARPTEAAQQPDEISEAQINTAIRALGASLPPEFNIGDLLPQESDDMDVQAERLMHILQLLTHDNSKIFGQPLNATGPLPAPGAPPPAEKSPPLPAERTDIQ